MFWTSKDIDEFLKNKQFIDTAIVPLVLLEGTEIGIKQSASGAEFLMSLTNFLEQQFKGRVVLTSPVTYTKSLNRKELIAAMHDELVASGFTYVFFITSDHEWTQLAPEKDVLWLPSIPLSDMDQKVRQQVLSDQLRQVIPMLSAKWSNQ
ncbi:YpiF family protein [Rummeliibacillus sp. G93]|uniref:DUF2487 family protein n=1 Tax=Rummeliibacillus TaxID=648802 RepID=UPI00201C39E5|nr:DUF2487 family protein [Rummeliibacillus sp. G93]UQW98543.1 YpiF family protein [Rummeliibacillus sp. G93]